MAHEWMAAAACRGMDLATFFRPDQNRALGICRGCPVRGECLDWALEHETDGRYRVGVFGGRTSGERGALARKGQP